MKEKFIADEYYEWRYCKINTASELISYINKIKDCIIGNAIDNIFIQPEFPPNRTHVAGYNKIKDVATTPTTRGSQRSPQNV